MKVWTIAEVKKLNILKICLVFLLQQLFLWSLCSDGRQLFQIPLGNPPDSRNDPMSGPMCSQKKSHTKIPLNVYSVFFEESIRRGRNRCGVLQGAVEASN